MAGDRLVRDPSEAGFCLLFYDRSLLGTRSWGSPQYAPRPRASVRDWWSKRTASRPFARREPGVGPPAICTSGSRPRAPPTTPRGPAGPGQGRGTRNRAGSDKRKTPSVVAGGDGLSDPPSGPGSPSGSGPTCGRAGVLCGRSRGSCRRRPPGSSRTRSCSASSRTSTVSGRSGWTPGCSWPVRSARRSWRTCARSSPCSCWSA